MDENATPRVLIRGVLTTGGIGESVKLSPRRAKRTVNAKKTPTDPPSRTEVATRLLTRSRSAKRKASADNTQTPSDSTTPRTLIAGFLQTAPVAKSVVKGKKQKTVEKPHTRRTSRSSSSTSQADDNTPRTIIQNFLREALTESPEKPVISSSSDVEDEPVTQQSDDKNSVSLVTSVADDNAGTVTDEQSVAVTTSQETDHVTLMEEDTTMLLDPDEEDESATQNTISQGMGEEVDSLQSTTRDQTLETDTVIRENETQTSRQWRDLVTPQLPLDMSSAGHLSRSSTTERSVGEISFFGGKPPAGNTRTRSPKRPSGPRMPSALVKSIFQHFSKAKLSKEALQVVENGSNLFFKQVSADLMAYSQHAHRSTIELADVELLMKRQGFITDNQSLYSLVEKYLPLEYRQEIIPMVQAGNKIVIK